MYSTSSIEDCIKKELKQKYKAFNVDALFTPLVITTA